MRLSIGLEFSEIAGGNRIQCGENSLGKWALIKLQSIRSSTKWLKEWLRIIEKDKKNVKILVLLQTVHKYISIWIDINA